MEIKTPRTSITIYKRIIFKLSGEALKSDEDFLSVEAGRFVAEEVKSILKLGVQVGIVIGGGNFIRGYKLEERGIHRSIADNIGMTFTIANAQFLEDIFKKEGIDTRVQSAIKIESFAEPYISNTSLAVSSLKNLFNVGTPISKASFATPVGSIPKTFTLNLL